LIAGVPQGQSKDGQIGMWRNTTNSGLLRTVTAFRIRWSGRHTDGHGILWNIAHYYRTGSNHDAISDTGRAKDARIDPQHHIVAEHEFTATDSTPNPNAISAI
jgi:hypothetical protein